MEPDADDPEIRAPSRRRCERCGRIEQWNSRRPAWECRRPAKEDAPKTRHCIHEWDVTGSFCPVVSTVSGSTTEPGHAG